MSERFLLTWQLVVQRPVFEPAVCCDTRNPVAYRVQDRKLLINEDEAPIVRLIFDRFVKLGSGTKLVRELATQNIRNRKGKLIEKGITGIGLTGKTFLFPSLAFLMYAFNISWASIVRLTSDRSASRQEAEEERNSRAEWISALRNTFRKPRNT